MLFAANWIWPSEPKPTQQAAATESPVEQTIRIQSERRWPDKIVFDTNQPTIVPPPAPITAISPPPPPPVVAANSPLDARAELKPAAVQPAPPPKRQAKVRRRNPRPDAPQPNNWQPNTWQPNIFASAGPQAPSWSFGRW